MIEWEDSRQPISSWIFLSDLPKAEIIKCVSVGWLVHDDKKVKMLAPNIGDIHSDDVQASGIIRIPARSITRIVTMSEDQ